MDEKACRYPRPLTRRVSRCSIAALLAFAIIGCQHPSTTRQFGPVGSARLSHPEELIIPPKNSGWPSAVFNDHHPRYPDEPRRNGVEARVVVAFVINEVGSVDPQTISIVSSPPAHHEFVDSVCRFLRVDAHFSWEPHAPARALVVMPFEFGLNEGPLTEPLYPSFDYTAVLDTLRQMAPHQIAEWVDSKVHCF